MSAEDDEDAVLAANPEFIANRKVADTELAQGETVPLLTFLKKEIEDEKGAES